MSHRQRAISNPAWGVAARAPAGISTSVKLHRIINQRLRDAEGKVIGDVNAAVAVNAGEPGGSHTHVESHSRIVQRTRDARATAPPEQADDEEDA